MSSRVFIETANAYSHRNTFTEFCIREMDPLRIDIPAVFRRTHRLHNNFAVSTMKIAVDLSWETAFEN